MIFITDDLFYELIGLNVIPESEASRESITQLSFDKINE